jgi:hypothetical protein
MRRGSSFEAGTKPAAALKEEGFFELYMPRASLNQISPVVR